jgi:PEGA domain
VKLTDEDRRRLELWRLNTPEAINTATEPVDPNVDPVLYITSVPKGAAVYIDGAKQGIPTDAFYWTKRGRHHVKWQLGGKTMEHDVFATDGEVVWMWMG